MDERPILFSGPMVRAILEGRKTQTRRTVATRLLDLFGEPDGWEAQHFSTWRSWCHHSNQMEHFTSPYGQPGDRLWVRETWLELHRDHWGDTSLPRQAVYNHPWPRVNACAYRADTSPENDKVRESYGYRWRPSIHMPRWASRLSVDIVNLRVERLHDISEADARAEGIATLADGGWGWPEWPCGCTSARAAFMALWKEINGAESWDANPWVWVVEFRWVEGSTP